VASSKDPTIPKPAMVNGASIAGAFITRAVDVQGLGRADTNHRYTTDARFARGWLRRAGLRRATVQIWS
jgi:hypothetical protein